MVVVKYNSSNLPRVILVGKDQEVNILQNRKLGQVFYDDVNDRVIFTAQDADGVAHLIQRGMDGVETELYKGKNLSVFLPGASLRVGNAIYLHDDSGTQVLDLKTKKISSFADIPYYFSSADLKGEYWITRKDGVGLQLTKSDMSKSYLLSSLDYTDAIISKLLFRSDLNEFVFRIHGKKDNADSISRLDLQDGSVKSLYSLPGGDSISVLDHVGDRYLIAQNHCQASAPSVNSGKSTPALAQDCDQQVGWLNADGTVTTLFHYPTQKGSAYVIGYNPINGTILISDGANKKLVLYSKDGQSVATLESDSVQKIPIWPTANNFEVLVVAHGPDATGQTSIGLLSPDTLGGDSGKDLVPVALGTIPANGQWPTVYLSDVHTLKVRTPAAVADTTEPCKPQCTVASSGQPDGCSGLCPVVDPCLPKCDGKQCGDDGCGGVCGKCAAGSSCDVGTLQCVANAPAAGPAPVISGIFQGVEIFVQKASTKTISNLLIKSDVGLASVKLECAKATIKAVPDFDPIKAKNYYSFSMQISNVAVSGACMVTATDLANQASSVAFVVSLP